MQNDKCVRRNENVKFPEIDYRMTWEATKSIQIIAAGNSVSIMYTIDNHILPFKARILEFGFISAESAVIGLLKGCIGILISTITTLFCGEVSRTHIYLSDSIVTWVNVMNCGLIPMLGSCHHIRSYKPITQLQNSNYGLKIDTEIKAYKIYYESTLK